MIKQLAKMRRRMLCTKLFLYSLRNNPRFTNRYYYWLIEIIGENNYSKSSQKRSEWDGARKDFDKMYGLVVAWTKEPETFVFINEQIEDLKKYFEALFDSIISMKNIFYDNEDSIIEIIKTKSSEEAKAILNLYIQTEKEIRLISEKENEYTDSISELKEKIKKAENIISYYKKTFEILNEKT